MHLSFLRVWWKKHGSFLLSTEEYSIVWRYHHSFTRYSTEGHLNCLPILTILNRATINICVQVFVWAQVFSCFAWEARSVTAEGHSRRTLSLIRNHHVVLLGDSTILHSHQPCVKVPVIPHPHQLLVLTEFWILTVGTGVQWYLLVFCEMSGCFWQPIPIGRAP